MAGAEQPSPARTDTVHPDAAKADSRTKVKVVLGLLGLIAVLGVAGTAFLVTRASKPNDALPGPLGSLKQHFADQGFAPRSMLVRVINVGEARHQARFWLRGTDERAIYVLWCNSPQAAQTVLQRMRGTSANSTLAAKGELVLHLPEWAPGEAMAQRVLSAFQSWPGA